MYSDSVLVWEKEGEAVQGLDVSRWSEKRVQVDFSNRLVFYSLKKEDEGHYRCIVDLQLAAMYHIEGLKITFHVLSNYAFSHVCVFISLTQIVRVKTFSFSSPLAAIRLTVVKHFWSLG